MSFPRGRLESLGNRRQIPIEANLRTGTLGDVLMPSLLDVVEFVAKHADRCDQFAFGGSFPPAVEDPSVEVVRVSREDF